jgi:hypothetical protein
LNNALINIKLGGNDNMKRYLKFFTLILIMMILITALTGCVPGDGTYTDKNPAGFFWGIWHGWIAPISLIASLFNHKIRVYEAMNTGWWYDFGFYIAIIGGFGSFQLTRKSKPSKDKNN